MPGVSIGSVSISVTPNAENFTSRLRSAVLPGCDALGAEAGRHIADGINAALRDIRVNATVDLDTSAARAALDDLGSKNVSPTVGLDDTRIVAALDELGVKLDELGQGVTDIRLTLEDADIGARLDDIALKLDDIGSRNATPKLGLDDSSFNRQLDEDMAKLDAAGSASASPNLGGGGGIGQAGLITGGILGGLAASPALPGALTGAGGAVGTLGLAVAGVAPALSAYSTMTNGAAAASKTLGTAAVSAANQVHSAQQSMISAEQQLQTAEYSEQQAQVQLTQARQQAVLTLQSLNNAAADANLSAKQAQLDLQQAQLTQQQVNASSTSTALQRKQADLSVLEAEQRLKEAQQARTNTANAAAKADKAGVDGMATVVAAEHNVVTSHQAVENAHRAVSNAQYQLNAAYASGAKASSGASSAALTYKAALAQLTPAGREMVAQIIGLQSGLKGLEGLSEAAIAPGFTAFLQGVHSILPAVQSEVSQMGGIISNGLAAAGKALSSSGFQEELRTLFDEGNRFIQVVGPAVGQMVSAFLEMGSKSGAAVAGLASGLAAIARGFGDMFTNLTPFASAIGSVLSTLGQAVGAIGGPLGTVLGSLTSVLAPLLSAALPVFKTLLGGIATVVAQLAKELLPPLNTVLAAIGPPLNQLAGVMGQFALSVIIAAKPLFDLVGTLAKDLAPMLPGIVNLLSQLATSALKEMAAEVTAMLPPMLSLVNQVFKALQPVLPPVEAALAKIAAAMAGLAAQEMKALAPALTQIAQALAKILVALVPLLVPVANLTALLAVLAARMSGALMTVLGAVALAIARLAVAVATVISWALRLDAAILNWVTNLNNLRNVTSAVTSFIAASWNKTYSQVSAIIGRLVSFFAASWDKTSSGVKSAFNAISSFITGSWNKTYSGISGIIGKLISFLSGSWNKMVSDAKGIWNGFVSWVTGTLGGAFRNAFQTILNGIAGVWNKLESIVKVPVNFIIQKVYDGGIVPVVNAVGSLIGLHLSSLPGLAAGGKITQGTTPTADDVLARVSRDETVVSAAHSRALAPIFAAIGVPGYASGGTPNPSGQSPSSMGRFGPIPGVGGVLSDIGHAVAGLAGDALAAVVKPALDKLVNAMPGGGTVLGADLKRIPVRMVDALIDRLRASGVDGAVGAGSGADVAKYAASFATGKGHPYVWGGSTPAGWDCSGATAWWLEHFGYFPEKPGTRHGTSESQFTDPLLQSSGAVPGALAFFRGGGGPPPGHVGLVLNPHAYVSALDTAVGTVIGPISGALGFRIPKGGFQAVSKATGSLPANWRAIATYLTAHGFTHAEAAGIAGNIKIESNGDPNVWQKGGGGGYGLIQWTPPPKGLVGSGLTGELAQIVREGKSFFSGAGLTNPASAAYQYLVGRERPANPGATAAAREASANAVFKAMGYDRGGWLPPGLSLTHNATGAPEAILTGRQWDMISSAVAGGDGAGLGGRGMAKRLDRMIHLLEQAPGRTGGAFAEGINGSARNAVQRAYFRTR